MVSRLTALIFQVAFQFTKKDIQYTVRLKAMLTPCATHISYMSVLKKKKKKSIIFTLPSVTSASNYLDHKITH